MTISTISSDLLELFGNRSQGNGAWFGRPNCCYSFFSTGFQPSPAITPAEFTMRVARPFVTQGYIALVWRNVSDEVFQRPGLITTSSHVFMKAETGRRAASVPERKPEEVKPMEKPVKEIPAVKVSYDGPGQDCCGLQ